MGIYATINNGFETLQVSESYPIKVLSGAYCALEYDEDSRPLLGTDRNGKSKQTFTIKNTGNIPLDSTITATTNAKDWDVSLSMDSIENLPQRHTRVQMSQLVQTMTQNFCWDRGDNSDMWSCYGNIRNQRKEHTVTGGPFRDCLSNSCLLHYWCIDSRSCNHC